MENLATCQVCERTHEVGCGWAFCTGEEYHNIRVGLRSVPEREEAFWQSQTQYRLNELPNAARLLLPSVFQGYVLRPRLDGGCEKCLISKVLYC